MYRRKSAVKEDCWTVKIIFIVSKITYRSTMKTDSIRKMATFAERGKNKTKPFSSIIYGSANVK